MDLAAVPLLHRLTHLPVIVDPSHATGKRWLVRPLALGGVAVGADGVMVEVHPDPDSALSDAEQQLTLDEFDALMRDLGPVHEHVRHLHERRRLRLRRTSTCPPAAGCRSTEMAMTTAARRAGRSRRRVACAATCVLPGDKSISHRALMLALLADGETRITGAGDGADVRSTAGIVEALGAAGDALAAASRATSTTSSRPAARRRSTSRPTGSTAATPGRACGCSPGSSPGCRSTRPSTATRRSGAVRWPESSSHCGRWVRTSKAPGTTVPDRRCGSAVERPCARSTTRHRSRRRR